MPRDGNGNYSLPSGNPVVTGTTISSAVQNTTMSDVATALTGSVSRDGQSPMTANLPMGGNKLTGLSAGTTAGDSLRYEQLFSQGFEQDLASAATVDIGVQNTLFLRITGTTTITSFGINYNGPRYLRFAGAVTITNSSTLVCPGGNNITTIAGDVLEVYPISSGSGWQVQHLISGNSLIAQRWTSYATDVNATFTASITTTVMTVTAVASGTLAVGQNVIGAAAGTIISSFGTGAGGTGTYNVSISQSLGSGTLTTNTAPNFTITPSVVQTSYATGQRYNVIFGSVSSPVANSPTINVSGLGAKNLKQYDGRGTKQSATIFQGFMGDIEYDGTDFVLLSPPFTTASVNTRNTILSGGAAITAIGSGLNVNLLATTTPVSITFSNGLGIGGNIDFIATITADVTSFWPSQTANVINYNYFDLNIVTGAVTGVTSLLPLISQDSTVAVSVVSGQHTYVYDVGIMYVGNGSTATKVYRVPAGQNLAGAATITSVSQYGKRNKQVISGISTALGNGNVFTHGFGRIPQVYIELVNVTAEGGWTAGQVMPWPVQGGYDGAAVRGISLNPSSIDVGYRVSTNAWQANSYAAGTPFTITPANWAMQFTLTPRNT